MFSVQRKDVKAHAINIVSLMSPIGMRILVPSVRPLSLQRLVIVNGMVILFRELQQKRNKRRI
jgi:hypothetical protein